MIYLNRQEQRLAIFLGVLLIISTGILLIKRFQPSRVLRITMGEPDFDAKEVNPSFNQKTYIPPQKTQKQQTFEVYKKDSLKAVQSSYKQSIERPQKVETPSKPEKVNGKININKASKEELEKLPGIGPVKAQNIIDYRERNNGFKSIDELVNVDGIGKKTLQKIRDLITLGNEN